MNTEFTIKRTTKKIQAAWTQLIMVRRTGFSSGTVRFERYLAGLHVPKKRFFFAVLYERCFLLTYAELKDFQALKSSHFCVGQQKKNRSKRTGKKNSYFRTCKPANC